MELIMENKIVTLEQAGKHLMEEGVVNFENMTVEGKQLLEVCGYSYGKDSKKFLDRQIVKHGLVEGVDFNIDIDVDSKSRVKPKVYEFSMNAANHVLLAAITDQGKAARQEAIDLSTTVQNNGGEQMLMDFIKQQQQFMVEMKDGFSNTLTTALSDQSEKHKILIHKKSEPISLSKMYAKSSKVVQAANLYLESEGYQTKRYLDGASDGWTLTNKGRDLGTQINPKQVFWVPEIKDSLPNIMELLSFAERLGLKDMKSK